MGGASISMKVNLKMNPAIATSVTFTDEEPIDKPRIGINYEGNKLYAPIGLGWDKKGLYSRIYNGSFKALWGSVSKRDDPVLENPVRSVTTVWNDTTKQMHLSFDEELFELLDHTLYNSMHVEYIRADRYDTLPGATDYASNSGPLFKITDTEMTIDFSNSSIPEGAVLLTASLYVHLASDRSSFNIFFFFGGARDNDKKCTVQVNPFNVYSDSNNNSFWSNPSGVTFTYNDGVLKITSLGTHFDQRLAFQYDDIRFVYVDPYTEEVTVFSLNEEHEVNAYAFSTQPDYYLGLRESSCWFSLFHTTDGEWIVMPPVVNHYATYISRGQFFWASINTASPLNAYCVPVEMAQKVKAQTGIDLIKEE
jgi:hypothetical protein